MLISLSVAARIHPGLFNPIVGEAEAVIPSASAEWPFVNPLPLRTFIAADIDAPED